MKLTEFFLLSCRMFTDSLDALHTNSGKINTCLLGSSELEASCVGLKLFDFVIVGE